MPAFVSGARPICRALSGIHQSPGTFRMRIVLGAHIHQPPILEIQIPFTAPILTGTANRLFPLKLRHRCFLCHTYLVQSKLYVINFDVIPLGMCGFYLPGERIPIQGTCHKAQARTGSAAATTHRVIKFYCYSCHLDLLLVLEMRHCNALFVFSCHFSET